ncbi:MAG TPA: hypothetical protein VIK95_06490, partial [Egibacteraceae bacterium]
VRYRKLGRDKVVRYWAMRVRGGAFVPGTEVDRLEWLTPEQARARLTYDRDREIIDRFSVVIARAEGG